MKELTFKASQLKQARVIVTPRQLIEAAGCSDQPGHETAFQGGAVLRVPGIGIWRRLTVDLEARFLK